MRFQAPYSRVDVNGIEFDRVADAAEIVGRDEGSARGGELIGGAVAGNGAIPDYQCRVLSLPAATQTVSKHQSPLE